MNKKNVAVIFGGRTVEHDVSIITGIQFIENMDKEKYNVTPIYIDNKGKWFTGNELLSHSIYKDFSENKKVLKEVLISPVADINAIIQKTNKIDIFKKETLLDIDVAVVAMHGMNGEDGTLQGLLELANIPYVGSGVLGSAVGMDKIVMKSVFKGNDLPILKYCDFLRSEWNKDNEKFIKEIESKIDYPMFIKPANLGSSIGISKAKNREGLINGINIAVEYDKRIIVEQGVENLIEINCSAMGYDDNIEVSVCEEPISWQEFLTFEDKYVRNSKGPNKSGNKSGMAVMDRKIPADIGEELTNKIQNLTRSCFKALSCSGVARVDYIIDKSTMTPYINEINTIPGSFSFYLWEYSNISYTKLIDKLIEIAEIVNREKNKNQYSFNSNIVENIGMGQKGSKM